MASGENDPSASSDALGRGTSRSLTAHIVNVAIFSVKDRNGEKIHDHYGESRPANVFAEAVGPALAGIEPDGWLTCVRPEGSTHQALDWLAEEIRALPDESRRAVWTHFIHPAASRGRERLFLLMTALTSAMPEPIRPTRS